MSEQEMLVMVERSRALRSTLRAGGYERGDGVSGEGIKLVTRLAKKHGLRDWPQTRDAADYDALIKVVRSHLLSQGIELPPPPCPFMPGDLLNIRDFWIYKFTRQVERVSTCGHKDYPLYGILAGVRIKILGFGFRISTGSFEPRTEEELIPMWYQATTWDGAGVLFGTKEAGDLQATMKKVAAVQEKKWNAKRYALSITQEMQGYIDQERELIREAQAMLAHSASPISPAAFLP